MIDVEAQVMRVRWEADDFFAVQVREHTVTVDQPAELGGADVGPTPTELFVAALASCVAFYARRYLRRHHIDPAGLEVTTSYQWPRSQPGSRPSTWRSTCRQSSTRSGAQACWHRRGTAPSTTRSSTRLR